MFRVSRVGVVCWGGVLNQQGARAGRLVLARLVKVNWLPVGCDFSVYSGFF